MSESPNQLTGTLAAQTARAAGGPRYLPGGESIWPTVIVIALLVVILQEASNFTPEYILPSPRQMLTAVGDLLSSQSYDLALTVVRLICALGISMVLGSLLGGVMGMAKSAAPYIRSLLFIMSGVPALSWMLLSVLWFPQPEARIFFILLVVTMPFYALNVYDGILALPPDWIEMLDVFAPTRLQAFRLLIFPHIVSYIILTTKSVSGYAIRMIVFAELIGSAIGVGARLAEAESMFRVDRVFGWTLLLIVLNFAIQGAISLCERRVLSWRPPVDFR